MIGTMSLAAREEHPLLSNRRRDVLTAVLLALLTVTVFLLVAAGTPDGWVQRLDARVLAVMVSHRTGALTAMARALDLLGSVVVMLPLRAVVAGYLALRRRWWHLTAFVVAMVASELLIGRLKNLYDRPRPPLSLVHTSGASFPSGHAVATSVTAVAVVLALFPRGRHRYGWGAAAALFALFMAVSRAYLAAHWLSDAVAGTLLGTSVALWTALVVQWVRDRRHERDRSPPAVRSQQAAPPR
jgi:membrane-associated phospholipid phosphatase